MQVSSMYQECNILLMEEILHQFDRWFIPKCARFYTSQVVVWDFFYQQYVDRKVCHPLDCH